MIETLENPHLVPYDLNGAARTEELLEGEGGGGGWADSGHGGLAWMRIWTVF